MAKPTPPAPEITSRLSFPSAYTILFALIVIMAGPTWVIPAGQYERVALGKPVQEFALKPSHPFHEELI